MKKTKPRSYILILFVALVVCLLLSGKAYSSQIALTLYATGLSHPLSLANAGDGSARLFVAEQSGVVKIIKNGVLQATPFLDITDRALSGGERGLLGIAFPPGYPTKGYFYVNYTRSPDGATTISRFQVTTNPDIAAPQSEEVILIIQQPFANHNGGQIAFSPKDGYLYIGMGDGGSGGDPQNFAQNLNELPGNMKLLGKLLRINVESGVTPYDIPSDNPLFNSARSEIWALGLRNPWRFSFDRLTGDLYIGDVGQSSREEVNFQPASSTGGENYGWNILEGSLCFNPPSGCVPPIGYSAPIAEYDHTEGCSITGGLIYRGTCSPFLQGIYLYGDFCTGRIWGLRRLGPVWQNNLFVTAPFQISSFGEDESGEIYVTDYANGNLYKTNRSEKVVDFNGDGLTDLAGVNASGQIYYTNNLQIWTQIPGVLSKLAK